MSTPSSTRRDGNGADSTLDPYCILNSTDNYASSFENKEIARPEGGGLSLRLPIRFPCARSTIRLA